MEYERVWIRSGEIRRAVRKGEITVPGGSIYGHRGVAAGSVDHEESNRQDQSRYQSEQSDNRVMYEGATTRRVVKSIATSRRSGLGHQESPN